MAKQPQMSHGLLTTALGGLEYEKARIEADINELKARLGQSGPVGQPERNGENELAPPKKRTMSASARKKIALAQKKRWSAYHAGQQGTPASPSKNAPKAKRKMSAAGRARIIAATKKRWAAYRKAKENA